MERLNSEELLKIKEKKLLKRFHRLNTPNSMADDTVGKQRCNRKNALEVGEDSQVLPVCSQVSRWMGEEAL